MFKSKLSCHMRSSRNYWVIFWLNCGSLWLTSLGCQVSWVMSVEVARFGMRESRYTHLIPDVCSCHALRILAVAVRKIGDVCCLSAPAHQPFSSNSLDLSAPEEAYSRNVRASGALKFWYEGVFKILTTGSISLLVACPRGYH